jgi:hypothetical protein
MYNVNVAVPANGVSGVGLLRAADVGAVHAKDGAVVGTKVE